MNRLFIISINIILLLSVIPMQAREMTAYERMELFKRKCDTLRTADDFRDSLRLLYDAYDLGTKRVTGNVGKQLLDIAIAHNDYEAQADMLKKMSSRYAGNDSIQRRLMEIASKIPVNKGRINIVTFLKMVQNKVDARRLNEAVRRKRLQDAIARLNDKRPNNLYERIEMLHFICAYLGSSPQTEYMSRYYNDLLELMDSLPKNAYAIRNLVFTHGAIAFFDNGDMKNALKYNRRMIGIIDTLKKERRAAGRRYLDYRTSLFERYCDMLGCYPLLSDNEVDEYYSTAMRIAVSDSDCMERFRETEIPTLYYLMAKKDYAKALPILKRQIDNPTIKIYKLKFVKYMIEAADSLGDKDALLKASLAYNKLIEDYLNDKSFVKYKELQVIYNSRELQMDNDKLELENREADLELQIIINIIICVSLLLLLALVIVVYRYYQKAHALSKNLSESITDLERERDNLKNTQKELIKAKDEAERAIRLKNDFIKNINAEIKIPINTITEYSRLIVDCVDTAKRPYLEKFAELVILNGELLSTIINDMFNLTELDNASMTIQYEGVNVDTMCRMAVDSTRLRCNPGVTMTFESTMPDLTVSTDKNRVEQVLINLLRNAAKFTEKGNISLSYTADQTDNKLIFSVTDTGIGVAASQKETIFERFVKLDKQSQGTGLGLTISRMIARILGGDVWLDAEYTKGACFKFSIPLK